MAEATRLTGVTLLTALLGRLSDPLFMTTKPPCDFELAIGAHVRAATAAKPLVATDQHERISLPTPQTRRHVLSTPMPVKSKPISNSKSHANWRGERPRQQPQESVDQHSRGLGSNPISLRPADQRRDDIKQQNQSQ
jgi:hypothetical protein